MAINMSWRPATADWAIEETDNSLYADERNFYKVEKWSKDDPSNIWLAKSGFGGTEYLLSGVLSEGGKRGMSYNHMAELLSWKPAQRFGLASKGGCASRSAIAARRPSSRGSARTVANT